MCACFFSFCILRINAKYIICVKYEKGFFPILKKYEGKFITFDDNIGQLEGSSEVSGRVIIFSFPNENLADQWYSSVEYQELSAFRREGTDTISIFKVKGQPPRN